MDTVLVTVNMDYYGGFNEVITENAVQLSGAAHILNTWIRGIENESVLDDE